MKKLIFIISLLIFTSSCGIYKYSDARKNPVNAEERVRKNMEEGRGFRLSTLGKKGGDFLFASSNPMWRASMDKLSFAPLSVVDYGGGVIITDWFTEENNEEEIKRAMKLDYPIIGINNRNLKNLKTDIMNSANLFTNITKDFTVIAESGIKSLSDIEMYNELGIFNFLIGESILRSNNYSTYIKKLLNNG